MCLRVRSLYGVYLKVRQKKWRERDIVVFTAKTVNVRLGLNSGNSGHRTEKQEKTEQMRKRRPSKEKKTKQQSINDAISSENGMRDFCNID